MAGGRRDILAEARESAPAPGRCRPAAASAPNCSPQGYSSTPAPTSVRSSTGWISAGNVPGTGDLSTGRGVAFSIPVLIWFGRPIEPWPNALQMGLPVGVGYGFGTESDRQAEEERLLAAHNPPLDVDELPGLLHSWYRRNDGCWMGSVSFKPPVHGDGISLSAFLEAIPADRLRPAE